jgi:hypothetical protein
MKPKYFFKVKESKSTSPTVKRYFIVHIKNSKIQKQKQASQKIITTYTPQPEVDNPDWNVFADDSV